VKKVLKLKLAALFVLIHLLFFSVFSFLVVSPSFAVTSYFWPLQGEVVTKYKNTGYKAGGHFGIDIEAEQGKAVFAPADGKVYWIGKAPSGETGVGLEHEDGKRTTYFPVSVGVARDQVVKQGDTIGTVLPGHGSSSATSLHFAAKTLSDDEPNDYIYMDPQDIPLYSLVGTESSKTVLDSQASGIQSVTSGPVEGESSIVDQTTASMASSPVQEKVVETGNIAVGEKAALQNSNSLVSISHTIPSAEEHVSANLSPISRNGISNTSEKFQEQISTDARVNKGSLRKNILNNWLQAILISIVPLLVLFLTYKGRAASGILPRFFMHPAHQFRGAS